MTDELIKIEKLCYSYNNDEDGNKTQVLFDIDLSVKKGEFVAILGRNGSGKSTLAKLLNMILVPDSGEVVIDGIRVNEDMSDDDVFALRRKIGMVFQNPDNQLVATIVEEDIAFGPENLGVEPDEIRRRVDASLEAVGMEKYARYSPHHLSGGQKQRIAIAGILAMMPECIVFDESTAMLDPMGRKAVMDTMIDLNREKGLTVITITHNMEEAICADRIVVMDNGRIAMQGTPREVFSKAEELQNMGLDVPQVTKLCHELRKCGVPLPSDVLTEEECANSILSLDGICG